MSRWIRSFFGRSLALLQIALLLSAGCSDGALGPTRERPSTSRRG